MRRGRSGLTPLLAPAQPASAQHEAGSSTVPPFPVSTSRLACSPCPSNAAPTGWSRGRRDAREPRRGPSRAAHRASGRAARCAPARDAALATCSPAPGCARWRRCAGARPRSPRTAHERLPLPRPRDELSELGETLNAMLDRLEDALDRQRAFVAEAGHELRTPLALLRAELDYALHYAREPGELRAALADAEPTRPIALCSWPATCSLSRARSRESSRCASSESGRRAVLESVRERFAWRAEVEGRELVLERCARTRARRPTASGSSRRSPTLWRTRFGTAPAP